MPNSFTPQQIEEFLQEFFDVVGARQYIGARYVPIFGRSGEDTVEWDDGAPYEPLTVVMHLGVSYVSRRYVPTGIQITDTDYWVETYRFSAQVEQYRQEVLTFQDQIDQIREDFVPFPDYETYPKYGTAGQVLTTLANGETKWDDPVVPSDEQAEEVITQWLDDHPEATTTVEDNSITDAKLVQTGGVLTSVHNLTLRQLGFANRDEPVIERNIVGSEKNLIVTFPTGEYIWWNIGGRYDYLLSGSFSTTYTIPNERALFLDTLNRRIYVGQASEVTTRNIILVYNFNATVAGGYWFGTGWQALWATDARFDALDADLDYRFLKGLDRSYITNPASVTTDGSSDMDLLKPNIMFQAVGLQMTNAPLPTINGFVISRKMTSESYAYGAVQTVILTNGTHYERYAFSTSGTWTDWIEIGAQPEVTPDIDYTKTFRNIAVFGDSITAGTMPDMNGGFYRDFSYSWASILFTQATIQDCSKSGANAKDFFTDATLLDKLENLDTKTEAVFVYLGTNGIEGATMGTTEDIVTAWDDTPTDTYYGWYSKLFKAIRHYTNDYCPITIINLINVGGLIERNVMLADCAQACGCLLADQNPYRSLYYALPNNNDGTHFTSAGYAGVAESFKTCINGVVTANPTYFNKTSLILEQV